MSRKSDLIDMGCSPGIESLQTSTGVSNMQPRSRTTNLHQACQPFHKPP